MKRYGTDDEGTTIMIESSPLKGLVQDGSLLTPQNKGRIEPGSFSQPRQAPSIKPDSTSGFEVFNKALNDRILQQAGSPFVSKPFDSRFTSPSAEPLSSEQAANNILNFIQSRIQADKAAGATDEELNQRLDEALEGFNKGFEEARGIIESLGLLNDELSAQINDTYDRVTNGIDELRDDINGTQIAPTGRLGIAESYEETQSFDLELVTQEGDIVQISFAEAFSSRSAAFYESSADKTEFGYTEQVRFESTFELSVQGDLNEEELEAINAVLADVESLAQDFYQGNLDEAFNKALELDINRDELKSLDLNLQQTQTYQAIAAYEQQSTGSNRPAIADINALLDRVDKLFDNAAQFRQPLELIDNVAQGVDELLFQGPAVEQELSFADALTQLLRQFSQNEESE
ncbi:DUF5610 domain-containing protein [Pleionea sp. CnH1-48]|uniref:DUF5610 domain-containing protein n=1 Tax=Pleionea sp. CnH1-48 TaxID=2954494 RepID=UPI0020976307|nr:DUF5610 domain-containing protein [Pleionea sp. CnH1-48]MCO7225369.1 DUF5610 domain-containing protein [Pleionea sp. CnH1-48]